MIQINKLQFTTWVPKNNLGSPQRELTQYTRYHMHRCTHIHRHTFTRTPNSQRHKANNTPYELHAYLVHGAVSAQSVPKPTHPYFGLQRQPTNITQCPNCCSRLLARARALESLERKCTMLKMYLGSPLVIWPGYYNFFQEKKWRGINMMFGKCWNEIQNLIML